MVACTEIMFYRYSLFFRFPRKIEFRDTGNLREVIHSLTTRRVPYKLCTSSHSTLISNCWFPKEGRDDMAGWYDCTVYPYKPSFAQEVQGISGASICVAEHGNQRLLIYSRHDLGIKAYNMETEKIQWSFMGKLADKEKMMNGSSLATDGRRHLFVCDTNNNCIELYTTDGSYVGTILQEGKHGIGKPSEICWSDNLSSLIIAHKKGNRYYLYIVQIA